MNVKVHVISGPSQVILAKYVNSKRFERSFKIVCETRKIRRSFICLHSKFVCYRVNFFSTNQGAAR